MGRVLHRLRHGSSDGRPMASVVQFLRPQLSQRQRLLLVLRLLDGWNPLAKAVFGCLFLPRRKDNNILGFGAHGVSVFLDEKAAADRAF